MALPFPSSTSNVASVNVKPESPAAYVESIVASSGFLGGGGTLLAPVLTIQGKSPSEIKVHDDDDVLLPSTRYVTGSQGNGHEAEMGEAYTRIFSATEGRPWEGTTTTPRSVDEGPPGAQL